VEVSNQFATLDEAGMGAEGLWKATKKTLQQVAKKHITKMTKKGNNWISEKAIIIDITI